MRHVLTRHPDSPCRAVTGIEVEAARPGAGRLLLHYFVTGDAAGLRLPQAAAPERTDGLWRQTCFEAFVRAPCGDAYYEFNFSPSTQWAAYGFSGYRSGMRPLGEIAVPGIATESGGRYRMQVMLDLGGLADLPADGAWRLALSAVIEETDGSKSWWALAHPPGRPDFHHPDGFTFELPESSVP